MSSREKIRLPLRKLFTKEREAQSLCSSSEADEMDGILPSTYCVWRPKAPAEKSSSPKNFFADIFGLWILRMDAGGLGSEVAFALREIVVSSVLEAMVAEALSATVRSASYSYVMNICIINLGLELLSLCFSTDWVVKSRQAWNFALVCCFWV
nr:ribosomal L1 domain-containing protein CG13096-like [Ipomoea batatas]